MRQTISKLTRHYQLLKSRQKKIVMVTAYDAPTAALLHEAGVDLILVGDSVGTVLLGYTSTRQVKLEEMLHHARAVTRGAGNTPVLVDIPLEAMKLSPKAFVDAAKRFVACGCVGIKIETGPHALKKTRACIKAGIPVMGHVGLTPQKITQQKKLKVQGRDLKGARRIMKEAKAFEAEGVFSLVLECVPRELGKVATRELLIPTIGIGAGPDCDGQVLVFHDLVGLTGNFKPRFLKQYATLRRDALHAVRQFRGDVKKGSFPTNRHTYRMDPKTMSRWVS